MTKHPLTDRQYAYLKWVEMRWKAEMDMAGNTRAYHIDELIWYHELVKILRTREYPDELREGLNALKEHFR